MFVRITSDFSTFLKLDNQLLNRMQKQRNITSCCFLLYLNRLITFSTTFSCLRFFVLFIFVLFFLFIYLFTFILNDLFISMVLLLSHYYFLRVELEVNFIERNV